ncbi:ABC transporter substrate-binding protein [Hungatella hathewayi]|uniref:ABC transporter substrate-binding protein n=1 Tax=Hungatella hathewayi TaxID=154046 RepID=UPI00033C79EB|nr:ABC transporter substrate-binding protein [Hungatella hathewayi]CCZ59861.1 putative dipeptide-binding protein [Hungatella hathewayi CAG:224]
MKTKRVLALFTASMMTAALLAGCGGSSGTSQTTAPAAKSAEATEKAAEENIQSGNEKTETTVMEEAAESVTVAVDDDSFTIGPWGGASAVRDWTENILWAHLAYRPFIGAMLDDGVQLVAAKSVTKTDDATYDIEIWDNIIDSQGNPIKAEDVVYSYNKLAELGYVTDIGTYYAGSEATGDYTLQIKLKNTMDGAIEKVLTSCSIASRTWYEGASENDINLSPATTGAYTVTDMQTGSSVTMEARGDYWKKEDRADAELQNVNKIILRCIAEASSRSIALENKEVDMAEVSASDVGRFEGNDAFNVTKYNNAMSQYLIFNTSENSPCADVNVRKAIAYAFDAAMVLQGSGSSAGTISHDVAPNLGPDYVQEWDNQDYFGMNLEKSAEYLKAAGYEPGQLEIHLMVSSQAPQGPYQALQAMLEQAGIKLVIDAYDRALRQTYDSDPTMWDMSELSQSVSDFTTSFWNILFSEDNYEYGTQGFTKDDKLQELLKAANAERSEENMNAFHDYVIENCYMVGLYTETRSIVTTEGLTDICLEKLNPVLNAMTFTEQYVPVAK